MSLFNLRSAAAAALLTGALAGGSPAAADGVVNIYSSRHYDNDEKLYGGFEQATGIKVNRIEDEADVLIERMKSEGRNSPADVFIATDAGRLWRAEEAGLLQPTDSEYIVSRIPDHFRHPEGLWAGYLKRARIIFINKPAVAEPRQPNDGPPDPKYHLLYTSPTQRDRLSIPKPVSGWKKKNTLLPSYTHPLTPPPPA